MSYKWGNIETTSNKSRSSLQKNSDGFIHLDFTSNLDDMTQRREHARGCIEYVLVLKGTSEEAKVKEYAKLTNASTLG